MPRLDASTRTIVCNARMPADQVAALARRFPVARVEDTSIRCSSRCRTPCSTTPRGRNIGMVHVTTPWPAAAAEDAA